MPDEDRQRLIDEIMKNHPRMMACGSTYEFNERKLHHMKDENLCKVLELQKKWLAKHEQPQSQAG